MKRIYKSWVESLSQAGIHPISDDTVAKILAIVYVYGGSMEFIYNDKLMTLFCVTRNLIIYTGNTDS